MIPPAWHECSREVWNMGSVMNGQRPNLRVLTREVPAVVRLARLFAERAKVPKYLHQLPMKLSKRATHTLLACCCS